MIRRVARTIVSWLVAASWILFSQAASAAPLDANLRPPSPAKVRRVLQAAMQEGGLASRASRISSLETRSRWSALLPTVRLRGMQSFGQSQSDGTDRDLYLTTKSGLTLDLHAIWSLDRLVFAHEELQVEHLRDEWGELRKHRMHEAAAAINDWARARAEAFQVDEGSPEWIDATTRRSTSEALLEELTGGRFADIMSDR